jgi:hypothetical protein
MQALAMGCELAFFGGLASSGLFVPRTCLPAQALLAALLDSTFLIVILGHFLQEQLHVVAVALAVSALCSWAGSTASDQTGIFDAVIQPMLDHRLVPVDDHRKLVVVPHQKSGVPFFRGVEHKAQSGIVALVLNAAKPSAAALWPRLERHSRKTHTLCAVQRRPLASPAVAFMEELALPARQGLLASGANAFALLRAAHCRNDALLPGAHASVWPGLPQPARAVRAEMLAFSVWVAYSS